MGTGYGVYGVSGPEFGTGVGVRAYGYTFMGPYAYGVYASAEVDEEMGIGVAIAGQFVGKVNVVGTLTKSAGSFKIDHPLDPENKYLSHSFVESPDMMNIYNGNVVLNAAGEAVVELPDWFEALNMDFRYQLTCVGQFAPVYVADKIRGNRFRIAGGEPGMEISWMVTGVRQDEYARAHRIPVEEDKRPEDIGKYRHPELYGASRTEAIGYLEPPEKQDSER